MKQLPGLIRERGEQRKILRAHLASMCTGLGDLCSCFLYEGPQNLHGAPFIPFMLILNHSGCTASFVHPHGTLTRPSLTQRTRNLFNVSVFLFYCFRAFFSFQFLSFSGREYDTFTSQHRSVSARGTLRKRT